MKDYLVYLSYRAGSAIVGALPGSVVRRAGAFAGWLAWTWAGDRKAMARRHMARVLGFGVPGDSTTPAGGDAAVEKGARGMFSAYGRYWAEVFWYRPRRFGQVEAAIRLDGLEHLRRPIDEGRAAIVTLPHMGNWEMAAAAADQAGVRITAVAETLGNPRITEWFLDMRDSLAIDVVLTDDGGGVTRRLLAALKNGQTVALLSDRDLSGRGVEVEFFGERTTLPTGPAALAIRTGAAIVPVAAYFAPREGHHIVLEPEIAIPSEGSIEQRVAAVTQELARVLEVQVRRHPEQWHLVQPNWPSDRAHLATEGS